MKITHALALVTAVALLGCTADNPDLPLDGDAGGSADMAMPAALPDGGADLGTTDPKTAVAEECAKLAAAVCKQLGSCSPYLLRYYYGDAATCTERVQLTCAPYVGIPGSSWTVERLRACTAGYTSGTCESYFQPGGPTACQPQAGTLADGAACANSSQCKSALCSTGVSGCGTCVQAAKSGAACTTARPCELGLTCTAGKCAASGGNNATCGANQAPCKTGFYCKTNTCTPVLAAGATCTPASTVAECDPIQGLYCDTTTRKCVAYKVVDSGQACGTVTGGYALCSAYGTCSGTAPKSKCVAAAADSAACGTATTTNLSCVLPAACTSGVCKVFDPTTCK